VSNQGKKKKRYLGRLPCGSKLARFLSPKRCSGVGTMLIDLLYFVSLPSRFVCGLLLGVEGLEGRDFPNFFFHIFVPQTARDLERQKLAGEPEPQGPQGRFPGSNGGPSSPQAPNGSNPWARRAKGWGTGQNPWAPTSAKKNNAFYGIRHYVTNPKRTRSPSAVFFQAERFRAVAAEGDGKPRFKKNSGAGAGGPVGVHGGRGGPHGGTRRGFPLSGAGPELGKL